MSEHDRLRLAVIIGSTRKGRFGPTIARWFVGRARRHSDLDIDVIDLAEADLPSSLTDEDEPVPRRSSPWHPGCPPRTHSQWSPPSTTEASLPRSRPPSTGTTRNGRPNP
ncbi:NADPH-dependent FMN reductase [Dactylosporangium darangshiense]|uniref:NADPH-dependent FMN reductase n=1 Tax=Dactylosporangium darangshiense TaxID=579108 RepID=UPI00363613A4